MTFEEYLKDHRVHSHNLIDIHSGWKVPRENFEEFYEAEVVKTEYNWRDEEIVYVNDNSLEFFYGTRKRLRMVPGDFRTLRELLEELKGPRLKFMIFDDKYGHKYLLSATYEELHEKYSKCLEKIVGCFRVFPYKGDGFQFDKVCRVVLNDFYEENLKDE